RGLGNSLMPKNLDHTAIDDVHWVSAAEAFSATRILHRDHALYMGGTSGAAFLVARWWAEKNPDQKVVALFPDEGHRYQDTIYNDNWLRSNGFYHSHIADAPRLVDYPLKAGTEWSQILWNRRSYEDVVGSPFKEGASV